MDFEKYLLWFAINLCAVIFGNLFKEGYNFYNKLILPPFAPKPFVYGIVWVVLYILGATGCCLLQRHNDGDWSYQLTLYAVFILVSSFFTFAFFKLQNLLLSLIIMLASSALIVLTTVFFFTSYPLAGWFILPTVVWVVFATYLMISIFINNVQEKQVLPAAPTEPKRLVLRFE